MNFVLFHFELSNVSLKMQLLSRISYLPYTNEIRLEKGGVYFVILEHLKLNLIKVHLMELDTEPLL